MLKEFCEKGYIDPKAYAELRELFGSDYEELVRDLVQKLPSNMDNLRAAIDASDISAIGNLAHSIKGMASNLGFLDLAARCEALERAVRAPNDTAFHELFDELKASVAGLR